MAANWGPHFVHRVNFGTAVNRELSGVQSSRLACVYQDSIDEGLEDPIVVLTGVPNYTQIGFIGGLYGRSFLQKEIYDI
ncbi:hypothetical protein CAC42_6204 [Sphaceloma murrayae]|uniref:Uncharacterized protein n=1 Tax=Sphaceloma murrayae TaxID=2082308 RepID=A0A2K1QTJ4_9PEZI|nr:hypothetical protein CAC42_6204 [Sphaceloma murrayae]